MGVLSRLQALCEEDSDREAACGRDWSLTRAQLLRQVERAAGFLSVSGIGMHSRVGLTISDERDNLVASLALLGLGCWHVILASHDTADLRREIAGRAELEALVAGPADPATEGLRIIRWADDFGVAGRAAGPVSEEGGTLLRTSGTTGVINLVPLSSADIVLQAEKHPGYAHSRLYRPASIEHNNSKRHRLYCLAMGGTNVFRPEGAYDLARYCETARISVVDITLMHASDLLSAPDRSTLRAVDFVVSGSEMQAGVGGVMHQPRPALGVGDAGRRLADTEPTSQGGPGAWPRIVSYYDELVADCATSAQLRGRQLAIETSLVPHEVLGLHEGLAETADYWRAGTSNRLIDADVFRASTQKWIGRLWRLLGEAGMSTPAPFERVSMSRSLVHYSAGGAASAKTLVLAFTGHGQCPMVPAAPFLQSLDATQVDMLMLRDLSRKAFQRGLEGIGRTTEDLWRQLPELARFSAYRRVVAIGFSSGTLAALATALRLGLSRAILFGPIDPVPVTWRDEEGRDALRFFSEQGPSYAGEIELVVGAEAAGDIAAARTLQSMMRADTLVVAESDADVGHNVVGSLLRQGRLRVELERMLGE